MAGDPERTFRADDLITVNRSATIARLLAGVVHDANNALQVISGTTELLLDASDLPEPVVKGLQRILTQQARAAAALAEVMTFSRQKPDALGVVDMGELVTRAIALRSYAINRARLTITPWLPGEVPLQVDGSALLLQQALLNLIVNAEQALAGRPNGAIVVDVERQEGWVQLSVSDNGPGVADEIVATMFDPFVTTRSRGEASGIGLTVAREFVKRHAGTLAHERRSPGAAFVLRIPSAP
jgi:two-component system C4-dicarboxylate transport sensor histidine kinase DctB